MRSGIVTEIKSYQQIAVANAMFAVGYRWDKPNRRPTNIDRMLEGVPRWAILKVLGKLKGKQ